MKALTSFYEEKYSVVIPDAYDMFQNNICSVFQFPLTQFNELIIFYHDADDDKIVVGNEIDYEEMRKQIANNEVKEIKLEVIEGSKLYVSRDMAIIKQNAQPASKQEEKKQEEIGISNQQNLLSVEPQLPQSSHEQVNIQQLFIDDNQANIQPTHNQQYSSERIFNYTCSLCRIYPIKDIIYVCRQCNLFICIQCEDIYGLGHPHSFLKMRSMEMLLENINNVYSSYNKPNIPKQDKGKENSNISDSMNKISNKIINFFNGDDEEAKQKVEVAKQKYDPAYIVRIARLQYDLNNISDYEILSALQATKNNLKEAVILIASKNK